MMLDSNDHSHSGPKSNGSNGATERRADGRFGPGNQVARGRKNPHARKVHRLRSALLRAVTPDDVRDVLTALLNQAKAGDVAAAKEFLSRVFGPVVSIDLVQRVAELEAELGIAQANAKGARR